MSDEAQQPEVELSFVGTDALIDELRTRHAALIVAGIRLAEPEKIPVRMSGQVIVLNGVADAVMLQARTYLRKCFKDG